MKVVCSKLLHNVEMYYFICINYLTTELAHSKLNMVYLAELLVVMTDRLKIVRIRAGNVLRIHGHKRLDDDMCLASLPRSRKATVLRARCARAPSCSNINKSSATAEDGRPTLFTSAVA